MSIVLLGSTSGSVTLQEPAVAGTTVIDLPATSGTVALTSGVVSSSVAGNGISVSGATGAVTFAVACPTFNSIGSYAQVMMNASATGGTAATSGSNYSVGTGTAQVSSALDVSGTFDFQNNLSGTWKWMGASKSGVGNAQFTAIACRVS